MSPNAEIDNIARQFISIYNPKRLILFGSQVKKRANKKSDIDLCVVAETFNKRELLTDMYLNIDCDKPLDLLLYTPEEWQTSVMDRLSFAHLIDREGVVLYAR